jgi:PEP-CTERM motif
MNIERRFRRSIALVFASTIVSVGSAFATTIPISEVAFDVGSTLTTFTGLSNGTEVNGLIVDGIQFQYSLGNGPVIIDGGPGVTNHIGPPNIVSIGNNSGVLTLMLPSLVDMFGYGYAILDVATVPNATSISLFNGATPVGALSYLGVPDPIFTGGFAGVQSSLPFNRVEVTFFNSAVARAFALDNIRTASAVPEPTTLVLLGTGVLGLMGPRSLHKKR